jgi:putative ABC transport system substrate-binding protein
MVWLSRNPANALLWRETNAVATALGVALIPLELGGEEALETTFEAAVQERVDSLIVLSSPAIAVRAAVLAFERRLPTMLEQASAVPEGGLLAYGSRSVEAYRRAAVYVDKILKGAKPADLPIEQPMVFDFVINLKTARALGLTIPQHVLLQATEVIQ